MNSSVKLACWTLSLGALLSSGCYPSAAADPGDSAPEIQLEGVGLKYFRGNGLRAVGKARQASLRRSSGDLTAESARVRFLADEDRSEVEVTAPHSEGNLVTLQATARGGVRATEAPGATGETEAASLDGKTRLVSGDLPVDVFGQGYQLHAKKGFVLDLGSPSTLALQGPVDTILGGRR